jgi:predicted Zn-dependent protease
MKYRGNTRKFCLSVLCVATMAGLQASPAQAASQITSPSSLDQTVLMDLIAAEIAIQRGMPEDALQPYMRQARHTTDPDVARRAWILARHSQDADAMLEAVRIWARAEPGSVEALEAASIQSNELGLFEEAAVHLEQLLKVSGESRFSLLADQAPMMTRQQVNSLIRTFEGLRSRHRNNDDLDYQTAALLLQAGRPGAALEILDHLISRTPRHNAAHALKAECLSRTGQTAQALKP